MDFLLLFSMAFVASETSHQPYGGSMPCPSTCIYGRLEASFPRSRVYVPISLTNGVVDSDTGLELKCVRNGGFGF